MKFKGVFTFLLGVGVGSAVTYFYCQKKKLEEWDKEYKKLRDIDGIQTQETFTEESTPIEHPDADKVQEEEKSEETFEEAIIKNSVLTESTEKPDLFDYAKISLGKHKNEQPVEKSHDPIEDEIKETEYKMRRIDTTEFDDLTYSYELAELSLYSDGYVTDYKDEVVYKLGDMYPNASLSDRDESGHIYVASDFDMMVYDITYVGVNYKDLYPDEVEGE